jgi:site-specific recombinase XerD
MSTQKKAIKQLHRFCPYPLDGINFDYLAAWVDQLRKKYSQTEIEFKLTAVKNFFCFCCREGFN